MTIDQDPDARRLPRVEAQPIAPSPVPGSGARAWLSRLHVRLLALVLIVLVPLFGAVAYSARQWHEHAVTDAQARALNSIRLAAAIHARDVEGARSILQAIAPLVGPPSARSPSQLTAFLEAELRHHPHYDNLGVADGTGRVLIAARRLVQLENPGSLATVREAARVRRLTVGDYEVDPEAHRATATLAYPIDAGGPVEQVLFVIVNLEWLHEFGDEALLPAQTTVTVFDGDGRIIAERPGRSDVGTVAAGDRIVGAALAVRGAGTTRMTIAGGTTQLVAFGPLASGAGGPLLYLAIGTPAAAATVGPDRMLRRDLFAFGFAVLLAAALGLVGSDLFVARQVTTLLAATKRLSGGDMTARAGPVHGAYELKLLASAFDAMAETLQSREQDIRRKHAELLAQEQRFRTLIEHSADGIVLFDAKGELLYTSPANDRITGYTSDDVVGRSAFDYVHEDDRERLRGLLAALLREPETPILETFRIRNKQGAWRWIQADHRNLLADENVRAIVANFRDVTAAREIEESLRRTHDELELRVQQRTAELVSANQSLLVAIADHQRAEEALQKLSRAIEQAADSVFVTNREGVIEYANPAFERMTGYSRAEAIGSTPKLFASGVHDAGFYQQLWRTILAGEIFRTIVTNRHKDGRLYYEDQTITPLRDPIGRITHFVSTGRDITHRRRTEEALRRLNWQLEQETTRIAGILHDEAGQFLTSAHITLAEVARDLPAAVREQLQSVRRNLDQVEEQLRQISRQIHPRILDDMGLVDAVRFLAEGFSRRTGIRVVVQTSLATASLAPAVSTVLYRLVQEGITNVGRHAGATEVGVQLSEEGRAITCVIRDNGSGFDVDRTLATRGQGLGLRVMEDRLVAIGGTLVIRSSPGSGTELRATVPLES